MTESVTESVADPAACGVHGWLLSGGEGRRMGGADKGLCFWHGHPLAWHVAQRLAPQVVSLCINANRNLDAYNAWGWPTLADDADLPAHAGPLVGILTGLRHAAQSGAAQWLQLAPCDSPALPPDLVQRLRQAAEQAGAQIAVPITVDRQEAQRGTGITPANTAATHQLVADAAQQRPHWTTALVAPALALSLEQALREGERKVGRWMSGQRWIGVCFDTSAEFININTPETLHGHP